MSDHHFMAALQAVAPKNEQRLIVRAVGGYVLDQMRGVAQHHSVVDHYKNIGGEHEATIHALRGVQGRLDGLNFASRSEHLSTEAARVEEAHSHENAIIEQTIGTAFWRASGGHAADLASIYDELGGSHAGSRTNFNALHEHFSSAFR